MCRHIYVAEAITLSSVHDSNDKKLRIDRWNSKQQQYPHPLLLNNRHCCHSVIRWTRIASVSRPGNGHANENATVQSNSTKGRERKQETRCRQVLVSKLRQSRLGASAAITASIPAGLRSIS